MSVHGNMALEALLTRWAHKRKRLQGAGTFLFLDLDRNHMDLLDRPGNGSGIVSGLVSELLQKR